MSFQLKVIAGPDAGKVILVPDTGVVVIGRGDVSTTLSDPTVSRQHFSITIRGGRAFIADRGSRAGTLVHHVRVTQELMPLSHAYCRAAGTTRAQFWPSAVANDTPATVPCVRAPADEPPIPLLPDAPAKAAPARPAPGTLPGPRPAATPAAAPPGRVVLPEF